MSTSLQEQANYLYEQILIAFSAASSSLQRLYDTAALHNMTVAIVEKMEASLITLDGMSALGEDGLSNATDRVPMALAEASRALMDVFSISLADLNLNASREDLERLKVEVESVRESADKVSLLLDDLQNQVFSLNNSAVLLLADSERLNNEAALLLQRSRDALALADESTTEGNTIIAEAEELLRQLQNRFSNVGSLVSGLNEIIMNVGRAEMRSRIASDETGQLASEARQVTADISTSMNLLEQASRRLNETLRVSIIFFLSFNFTLD